MLNMAPNTILRHVKFLVEKGWLDERNNPVHKWDRTKQYRVNLLKIHNDLLEIGYTLQDYKIELPFSKMENAFSKMENGSSKMENQISKMEDRIAQNGKAIPEITTEEYNIHSSIHPYIHHHDDNDRARARAETVDNVDCVDNVLHPAGNEKSSGMRTIKAALKSAGFEGLPVEVEYISRWVDVFPLEMIRYALSKAVLNGKKSLPYIAGIFEDWLKKGIRTIEEAERETRYDSVPSRLPGEKNQDRKRIIKLPDPQVYKDYINRHGG